VKRESDEIQRSRIQTVVDEIERDLKRSFDMDELARLSHYSESRFQELFTRFVHEPVFEYIRKRRLTAACDEISIGTEPISRIARTYGYCSAGTFARAFKVLHGITPNEFRRTLCPVRGVRPARVWPNPATPQMPLFQTDSRHAMPDFWQCSVTLSMPRLSPPAVMVGVFDTDPVKRYAAYVADASTPRRITSAVRRLGDRPSLLEFVLRTTRAALWNQLFAAITADHLSLVYGGDSPRHRVVMISSNRTGGRRWLATRIAGDQDNPVCWSVEFDGSAGASTSLVLTSENQLDLDGVFTTNLDHEVLP
jgi:AraC-like DNA-binding protein